MSAVPAASTYENGDGGENSSETADYLWQCNIYFYEDIRILGEQEFPVSQLHLLEQYMEHNEIFKVKNLVQEIFSEELVKNTAVGIFGSCGSES